MFGSKPTTYIRSPVGSGDQRRVRPASTPEAVIGDAMLMHQAMIKVVRDGGIKEKGALSKQLFYIARKGKVEVARGDGDRESVTDQADVIKDWEADFARADPRMTFFTYQMIVSYPRETDDAAARVASEDFAARLAGGEYGDKYKEPWGVAFGKFGKPKSGRKVLKVNSELFSNMLVSAPPGSGETAGIVIPTLLEIPHGFMVYDIAVKRSKDQ